HSFPTRRSSDLLGISHNFLRFHLGFHIFALPTTCHASILTQTGVQNGFSSKKKRWGLLGTCGVALGRCGNRRCDQAANGVLRQTSEPFGEEAGVGELGLLVGPADMQQPVVDGGFDEDGLDVASGDDGECAEILGERPDVLRREEKLRCCGRSIALLIFAAANNGLRAQFACLKVGGGFGFSGRQENGGDKEKQPEDRGQPAVPKAQRQYHQGRAEDAESYAEQGPGLFVAMKLQQLGGTLDQQEGSGAHEIAQALEGIQFAGDDSSRCRAHDWLSALFYLRLEPLYLPHSGKGAARNGNGTARDQGNVQGVDHLGAAPADFTAANQVIADAVIAAQNGGSNQAEEFLGFGVQGTAFVGLVV